MDIAYDADKDEINRFKHRLPLAFGARVFDDNDHVIVSSFRPIDGEDRHKGHRQNRWQALHRRSRLA